MADAVLLDVEDGIASIRLNRPDRLNVLSVEVSEGLRDAVESAVSDASVRVIVLSGEGRSFMAGGDLRHMAGASDRGRAARELIDPIHAALKAAFRGRSDHHCVGARTGGRGRPVDRHGTRPRHRGRELRVPFRLFQRGRFAGIAVAHGRCHGCWAIAAPCRFALIDDGGIPADRALELGLVSRVVADDSLIAETCRLAGRLRDGAPAAQAANQAAFPAGLEAVRRATGRRGRGVRGLRPGPRISRGSRRRGVLRWRQAVRKRR